MKRSWRWGVMAGLAAAAWAWAADAPSTGPASGPAGAVDGLDPLQMLRQRTAQESQDMGPVRGRALPASLDSPMPYTRMNGAVDPQEQRKLAAALTDEQVLAAMNRGVEFLLAALKGGLTGAGARPRPLGRGRGGGGGGGQTWGNNEIGVVALPTYALMQVGRSTDDARLRFSSPELSGPVNWLVHGVAQTTYSAALQANALSMLPPRPEFRAELARVQRQITDAIEPNGGFGYVVADPQTHKVPEEADRVRAGDRWWDNSNSQYALLGVWSASEADVPVDLRFWRLTDGHWRNSQLIDGGWPYYNDARYANAGRDSLCTMNVAGVASLFVTTDRLGIPVRYEPVPDKELDRGLARVAEDFAARYQRLSDDLYYSYGVERVGLASGRRYLQDLDWYRQGAANLILSQAQDGSWDYESQAVGTAYALLFLTHGRNPVAFSKLQYEGPWDARPRDDANLTRWVSKQLERPLNWEIVDVRAPVEDWLEAPVLLITGHGEPKFGEKEIAKIRAFTQAGGLIFSTADGEDDAFTKAIRRLMLDAFDRKYEVRELPADHPVFRLSFKPAGKKPALLGLSNGLREIWIHSPVDMGAAWESRSNTRPEYFQIPANIYLYATGQTHQTSRLITVAVPPATAVVQRKITLGRLVYSGNWDPEPGAWPRLSKLMALDGTELTVRPVGLDELNAGAMPVVHMTGTTKFELSDESIGKIKTYIDAGGTLICDAAGSSDTFASSFLEMVKGACPQGAMEVVDPNGNVFDGSADGSSKVESVEYRVANRKASWTHQPDMMGLKINGRWAILFSPADITSGLLGTNTYGIAGYKSASAAEVAKDMVMAAVVRPVAGAAAVTQPATEAATAAASEPATVMQP